VTLRLVVTGTDTGVGKTMLAAALAAASGARYWKPVQSGMEDGLTDRMRAQALGAATMPEAWKLRAPLSPHRAAELESIVITDESLALPETAGGLVVEGAGGVLVPIRRDLLFVDLLARWSLPVVLVARTGLGTINHSLLSIEALRARRVPIQGIAFSGRPNEDNEATIAELGHVRRLGRLPCVVPPDAESLSRAFNIGFKLQDFTI
jgi:dethiobiotin synthetase